MSVFAETFASTFGLTFSEQVGQLGDLAVTLDNTTVAADGAAVLPDATAVVAVQLGNTSVVSTGFVTVAGQANATLLQTLASTTVNSTATAVVLADATGVLGVENEDCVAFGVGYQGGLRNVRYGQIASNLFIDFTV